MEGHPCKGRVMPLPNGVPGRFGDRTHQWPTRAVLVLGRHGQATSCIRADRRRIGNMSINIAVSAGSEGLPTRLLAPPYSQYHLGRLTFVASDARRALEITGPFRRRVSPLWPAVTIEYEKISVPNAPQTEQGGARTSPEDGSRSWRRQNKKKGGFEPLLLTRRTIELNQDGVPFLERLPKRPRTMRETSLGSLRSCGQRRAD